MQAARQHGWGTKESKKAGSHEARRRASGGSDGDVLSALEELRPLVRQHGADTLKRLIDVLD